jgi:hypothetical protein
MIDFRPFEAKAVDAVISLKDGRYVPQADK